MHLRTQNWIDARKLREREDGRFDVEAIDCQICGQVKVFQLATGHYESADTCERNAGRFGNERHGARRARIYFEHVDAVILDRELNVHQAYH